MRSPARESSSSTASDRRSVPIVARIRHFSVQRTMLWPSAKSLRNALDIESAIGQAGNVRGLFCPFPRTNRNLPLVGETSKSPSPVEGPVKGQRRSGALVKWWWLAPISSRKVSNREWLKQPGQRYPRRQRPSSACPHQSVALRLARLAALTCGSRSHATSGITGHIRRSLRRLAWAKPFSARLFCARCREAQRSGTDRSRRPNPLCGPPQAIDIDIHFINRRVPLASPPPASPRPYFARATPRGGRGSAKGFSGFALVPASAPAGHSRPAPMPEVPLRRAGTKPGPRRWRGGAPQRSGDCGRPGCGGRDRFLLLARARGSDPQRGLLVRRRALYVSPGGGTVAALCGSSRPGFRPARPSRDGARPSARSRRISGSAYSFGERH